MSLAREDREEVARMIDERLERFEVEQAIARGLEELDRTALAPSDWKERAGASLAHARKTLAESLLGRGD